MIGSFAAANAESAIGIAVATPATGVTYLQNRFVSGEGFPSGNFAPQEQGFLGPSLIGNAVVVPEANAGLLAALALPVIGFVAARRKK